MLNLGQLFKTLVTSDTNNETDRKSGSSFKQKYFQGEAVVDEAIHPHRKGRVRFRGSWWFAKCEENLTIPPGELVKVLDVQDITLIVKPYSFE